MRLPANRIILVSVVLIFLIGPFLGLVIHRIASRSEREHAQARFEELMSEQAHAIEKQVLASLEPLHALRSFFSGSEQVTRQEFHDFTSEMLVRHPLIQALEWIPRVDGSGRSAHEREAQAEGFDDYRINDHRQGSSVSPSPPRVEYYPVYYVEPFIGNKSALGYDVGSERVRQKALIQAMRSGEVALSDPIQLVQEQRDSQGILAFLALKDEADLAQRRGRQAQTGFVALVFRTDDIVREALVAAGANKFDDMKFELCDIDVLGSPRFIHASTTPIETTTTTPYNQFIDVGNQRWKFTAFPTSVFLASQQTNEPLLLGAGFTLLWILLCGAAIGYAVRMKNVVLQKQAKLLNQVCCNLTEGVVVADRNGKFVLFNAAAEKMIGAGATDRPSAEWAETYGIYLPDAKTLCHPERLPLVRALRGETIHQEELFIRNPDTRKETWLNISGTPLIGDTEQIEGGVVVLSDVTKRKNSKSVVKRLYSAVESTDDTVFITDHHGKIEYVNPAFERTTGYAKVEALGETPRLLKSDKQDDRYYRELWSKILEGKVYRSAVINRKKCGELYHADQTITPISDTKGHITHFVSVVKDMTEFQKLQEQKSEIQMAALVQQKLYPECSPRIKGFDIAGAVFSAEVTCGDYYDFIDMPDGGLGIVVGDVSGHGIGPALIMAQVRAYLRTLAQQNTNPGHIIDQVNKILAADLEKHRYVTMLFACIDPTKRNLVYANAGHIPGYVLDRDNNVKTIMQSSGLPLGMLPDTKYPAAGKTHLEAGDIVLLLTDGVSEYGAREGNFFEDEDILATIVRHRHESAQQIVNHIHVSAREHANGAPQCDDLTMIVCKVDETTAEEGLQMRSCAVASGPD